MNSPDGGPAFPMSDLSGYGIGPEYPACGMSLRDWFAGQAMAAFAINPSAYESVRDDPSCAARAYDLADAMIAEKRRRESAE